MENKLFESILAQETQRKSDAHIQCQAERVGLILTVCNRRKLTKIQSEFENALSLLVQEFADKIDNELLSTKEDVE